MDSNSLCFSLELVAGSGNVLTVEQRAALQTSFVIMKKDYKFQRTMFWGKVLGVREDYLIAQGRGDNELRDKTYLYSFDCMEWFLLPLVRKAMIADVAIAAKGRFTGDPTHIYEHIEMRMNGEGETAVEEEFVTKVNEEKRLAVVVYQIDEEASVVPRGAFIRTPQGHIQVNRGFCGLSELQAMQLDSYLHFRKPKNARKKCYLEMGELNPGADFLDLLTDDIPKGSWSLQLECASTVCVVRNLMWLGFTFYHVPMTPQHGHIYIGDGIKNWSIPFMM